MLRLTPYQVFTFTLSPLKKNNPAQAIAPMVQKKRIKAFLFPLVSAMAPNIGDTHAIIKNAKAMLQDAIDSEANDLPNNEIWSGTHAVKYAGKIALVIIKL